MPRYNDFRQTKSHEVSRRLYEWIEAGRLLEGEIVPSEKLLAAELEMSRGTVRRGLQALVEDGMLLPRPGVGYEVRSRRKCPIIGMLFSSSRLQVFHHLLYEALLHEVNARSLSLRTYLGFSTAEAHYFEHTQLYEDLRSRQISGLITCGWRGNESDRDKRLKATLEEFDVPRVQFTSRPLPHAIGIRYGEMAAGATRALAAEGRRRIALVIVGYGPQDEPGYFEGYCRSMIAAGNSVDPGLVWHLPTSAGEGLAYGELRRRWGDGCQPDALIVTDDIAGKGMVAGAVDLGLEVPGRLRIATLVVKGSKTFFPRPVMRLEIDPTACARAAMDRLQAMLDDGFVPTEKLYLDSAIIDEAGECVNGAEILINQDAGG